MNPNAERQDSDGRSRRCSGLLAESETQDDAEEFDSDGESETPGEGGTVERKFAHATCAGGKRI